MDCGRMTGMEDLHQERIGVTAADSNMKNYEETYASFRFEDVEKQFSWHETGKVNMAYEAIDRHVHKGKGDKIALYYSDNQRDETYTFNDMSRKSNSFANVLRKHGIGKGERVFI